MKMGMPSLLTRNTTPGTCSAAAVLPLLISQTYRPAQADALKKTLELLKALRGEVPFYTLTCNMQPDAALTAFRGLSAE